jgi:hypothetical protein
MPPSSALRSMFSKRLRQNPFPKDWSRFTQLWMAFNAVYSGEPDRHERARVRAAVRNRVSESTARQILRQCSVPIQRIIAIPPGDMRLGQGDPRFRRASREQARLYARSRRAVDRLAAIGGILYQIRCNLFHGSKTIQDDRDVMLVRESVRILELLAPAVE